MSTSTPTVAPREAPTPVPTRTVAEHLQNYFGRLRGGDMGALPAVFGLVALCITFTIARPEFFSAINFANLFIQGAAVTLIAMGLVFVLLLGEIDLSAGYASGVCASVLAVLLTLHGWPWYGALAAALAAGAVIGLVLGVLVAKMGIPSFVVTLAAFLAFQGVVLLLIKGGTNVSVQDKVIVAIENSNVPPALGWLLAAIAVGGYAAVQLVRYRGRMARGLVADPFLVVLGRIAAVAVLVTVTTYILNLERSINTLISSTKGMPIVVPLIVVLLVVLTFVLQRTVYGRHIFAVGGNAEAARRAGINVDRIKISVFVICSLMAAVGGVVAASRGQSVDPNTGGSNVLLYAVGAAVIGGTSLFGGKGRILDAVIGGAVVAVIDNGMNLLGFNSGIKYMLTGLVLLGAAVVDALSRRRSAATGHG
ncbi:sugar ABC transporter permease [Micromonospora sp. NPDC050397]|uniref:sugar ABC transporter permease n=1 Tax=Micromonospora sp. NPDC050397 TaxID=3364279 RepID=UPI00384F57F2